MKESLIREVTDILLSLVLKHELVKKMKYSDKFEKWEDFWLHILNVIYDWELEDLNEKFSTNFPGIDLWNEKWIWVQVTVDDSTNHIRETIKTYKKGYSLEWVDLLPNKYPHLKFLFISSSHKIKKKYSHTIWTDGFNFTKEDIITFDELLKKIESKPIDEIKKIKKVLDEFSPIFDSFIWFQLRKDNYKLIKEAIKDDYKIMLEVIKEHKDEFIKDSNFQNIIKSEVSTTDKLEISTEVLKEKWTKSVEISKEYLDLLSKDPAISSILEEISWGQKKVVDISAFLYDFDSFSDVYAYIIKNIERIKKQDLTPKESKKFYENISQNSSYILHFFDKLWKLNTSILQEIIDNLVYIIIENNADDQNLLSIVNYFEKYVWWKNTDVILSIFNTALDKTEYEFLFRRVAILLAQKSFKSFDTSLMLDLVSKIVQRGKNMAHEFIVEFLSKNIDHFDQWQVESIMNLFDFEGSQSNELISINASIREEKYLPDIFWKILYIDYKLTFHYFWKLIKLVYENDSYSSSKRTLQQINSINYIGYYSFPEVTLSSGRKRHNLQENVFVTMWQELIKAWKNTKNRDFFIEVVSYIIERGDYSVFYELISFALVDNKEQNLDLIRALVQKKEIYPFINIFQERWGVTIFSYMFSKEGDYIEEFQDFVVNDKEIKSHEYHQAYLLSTIPKDRLSEEWEKVISEFLESHDGYKISFRSKPSVEVSSWTGRAEPMLITLSKRETLAEIYKKCDIVLWKERGWDLYDYGSIVSWYFKNNLDQIKDVYLYISSKWEDSYIFASLVVKWFIEYSKEKYKDSIDITFYRELVDIYSVLKDNDSNTKLEIWRILDDAEFLWREFTPEIQKEDSSVYEWVKWIVLDLASSMDPTEDSDNDWLVLWLNTVRGLGTITCSILLYYYPDDEDLKKRIMELSNDKLFGIQATLISKASLFQKNNKRITTSILKKHIHSRNKTIDKAIVEWFLPKLWYVDSKELFIKLLKWLLASEDKDIQNKAWTMLSNVILSWINSAKKEGIKDYLDILYNIIGWKIGSHQAMLWFCFWVQRGIVSAPKVLQDKLDVVNYILDNYKDSSKEEDMSIYYRLSFIFYKENIFIEDFDILYKNEIFQKLIEKSRNVGVYWQINEYLKRVLDKDWEKVVDQIKLLIKLQVEWTDKVFQVHSFTHIEDLLAIMYEKYDGKNCPICNMIFEKGLEMWLKEYKDIYDKYYKE